jgi:hypothetical protein
MKRTSTSSGEPMHLFSQNYRQVQQICNRFAVSFFQASPGLQALLVVNAIDWSSYKPTIDISRLHSKVAIELVKRIPDTEYIVQDLSGVISGVQNQKT